MKISVVRADNIVVVDGVSAPVDCSDLPSVFRAIQWDGERGSGHIEFTTDPPTPNLAITTFDPWEHLHERWSEVRASVTVKEKEAALSEAEHEVERSKAIVEQKQAFEAAQAQAEAFAAQREQEARASGDRVVALEERIAELESKIAAKTVEAKSLATE